VGAPGGGEVGEGAAVLGEDGVQLAGGGEGREGEAGEGGGVRLSADGWGGGERSERGT